jgi:hypothetical protein
VQKKISKEASAPPGMQKRASLAKKQQKNNVNLRRVVVVQHSNPFTYKLTTAARSSNHLQVARVTYLDFITDPTFPVTAKLVRVGTAVTMGSEVLITQECVTHEKHCNKP